MKNGKTKPKKNLTEMLNKSPINYLSDLFIVAMVVSWIAVIIVMVVMAIWATVNLCDTSIWCEVGSLVSVPLTAGGAIWMVKNSVQHAIANNRGQDAPMDFPAVNADGEDSGLEREWNQTTTGTEPDDESPVDDVIDEEALG